MWRGLCRKIGESGGRRNIFCRGGWFDRGGRDVRRRSGTIKEELIGLIALKEVILGPNIIIICPGQVNVIFHEEEMVWALRNRRVGGELEEAEER
jgi:hypothetical protein